MAPNRQKRDDNTRAPVRGGTFDVSDLVLIMEQTWGKVRNYTLNIERATCNYKGSVTFPVQCV